MNLYPLVTTVLAGLALVAYAAAPVLLLALAHSGSRDRLVGALLGQEHHPVAWALFVALLAAGGSLYLSEVAGLIPCEMCWYQRIAMYPLVVVLAVGLWRRDPEVWRYGLPLALAGLPIAAYHVLIQLQPNLEVGTCNTAVPCTARYMAVFGFVSIPVMAGAAFLLIAALLLLVRALDRAAEAALTTDLPSQTPTS